ncbi:MAG TPA: hybrid sensor histidine kinase/response regulator transcription factor, partial [Bacteroidales bacterium]|nr:hybrid sensor histidine kinase/response regulator transcription factor [Bacteroidales bacterium]
RFNTITGRVAPDGVLSGDLIYKILYDDKNKCLWIGTSTNVMRLEYTTGGHVVSAFPGYELPHGAVRSMISDKNNNLWFSVGGRLMCYLDEQRNIRELNRDLLGDYAILSSTVVSVEGIEYLVFGTTDNLIMVDPGKLLNREDEAHIVLAELQLDHNKVNAGDEVFGIVVMNEASEYVSSISLSYKCRWISLQFVESGLDLFVNRYQYYINGFSNSWQYLEISNPLTFSQLSPGKYTLQIRRFENNASAPVCWSITLNIIPPWWKTGWFTIILVAVLTLLAVLIVWIFIIYSRKKHAREVIRIEKEKEDELLREKESFFTGLSHDLMTPFSLIMSPANDLIREYPKEDTIKEKLRIIRKNASFLSDIFGTILDFKRAELSGDDIRETQIEIVAFARMVVNAFDYLASSRNIHLGYSANIASLEIVTDNVKIERILFNLISNALKFTPDGGKIDVELISHDNNMISMVVRDSGTGMDMKKQAMVFEKFYRDSEGEYHGNKKGLGLGLYIVRKFTDKLRGTIKVTSAPGKGTEIKVSFPVKAVSAIAPDGQDFQNQLTDDKSTILVVEDNAEMSDYIRNKLIPHFNVFTANSGVGALSAIEGIMPEIVITDIMMPGMDGLALTQKLKGNARYADIFVVLLTARVTIDDELEGYKKGADLYIKKPFDGEVLLKQMINIHTTRQKRKSQIMSWLVSDEEHDSIEFDPKESFLQRSMQVIDEHIMEPEFKIDEFASALNMSKTVLHRKFRLFVGQTPNQFIRLVRLRKSVQLLQTTDHSIAEIAYLTGFNQSHYFIKCFREVYNQTPGDFRAVKRSRE